MKKLISVCALFLACQAINAAAADDAHYRPLVHGKPAGIVVGTLVEYGEGMASGAVAVRTGKSKVMLYTAASPFTIDGKRVACPIPPGPPSYQRDAEVCFRWPSYVKIGITRVRVPYWRGTRYGQPTLIARGLTVVK